MKYLLSILLLIVISFSASAMSFSEARGVYNRIARANGINPLPLKLLNSSEVNAEETGQEIYVYKGMLRFVRNQSEMALVLGHELSHYTLHHRTSTKRHEYAADKLGAVYMRKAGYDVCLGAQAFKRYNSGPSDDHPDDLDRLHALGCH